jgi:hypothetical protein
MSDILEKAKEHFRSKLTGEMLEIDVPEWGTKLYCKPMNGVQRDAIMKHVAKDEYFAAQVEALIQRACDAEGKRLFSSVNRLELMRQVDPRVIDRIASQMGSFEDIAGEEVTPKKS